MEGGDKLKNLVRRAKPKGIYVHIPFCRRKCPYCDFVSGIPPISETVSKYFEFLKREFDIFLSTLELDLSFVQTVYFGGGTPGLFPRELESLLDYFLKKGISPVEVTVELNPDGFNPDDWKFATRLSFGVQTFNRKHLEFLGREHGPEEALITLERASAKFSANADIIFAIPGQSPDEHLFDLRMCVLAGVQHISTYMLTVYEGTQLWFWVREGKVKMPEDVDKFFEVQSYLEENGFLHYEISNWALPSFECKHNMIYWTREDFLGIGISAWSKLGDVRFGITPNLSEWFEKLSRGKLALKNIERTNPLYEEIFLGLRLLDVGIDLRKIENIIGFKIDEGLVERELYHLGRFLVFEKGRIKLRKSAISVADSITVKLMQFFEELSSKVSAQKECERKIFQNLS